MDENLRKQLMSTLEDAIELETEVATQDKIRDDCLEVWRRRENKLRAKMKSETEFGKEIYIMWGVLGILGLIFLILSATNGSGYLVVGLICFVICILVTVAKVSRKKEKTAMYESKIRKLRMSRDEMILILDELKENTKKALICVYKTDFIYPKYHYLQAVTSIYEYFVTGRCDELTGSDGAYNMYENEMRKDGTDSIVKIISSTAEIINNPEIIMFRHYVLYRQACSVKDRTGDIITELENAAGSTVDLNKLPKLNLYRSHLDDVITRISAAYGGPKQ